MSYRNINIFVSHPFVPDNPAYDLEKFRTNIRLLIVNAENEVRRDYKDFDIDTVFEFSDFQRDLPEQIEAKIRGSHFAIVDITENKPNIFFEYGLMRGLGIPALLIKAEATLETFPLPADIKNKIVISYKEFSELEEKCHDDVVRLFKQLLNSDTLFSVHLPKIWFPPDARIIHAVAPPEQEKSEYASPASKNYIFLNNLGDIDSVLEVTNFLNRNYRGIPIRIYASDTFNNHLEDNLVVIGGPGVPDESDEDGNSLSARMTAEMDTRIGYEFGQDDEFLVYKGQQFSAIYRGGKVLKDYGYFARFPNPFNPKNSVILIHGIHTFGVLGAAKAFSDHPSAQGNIRKVMDKLKLDDIKQASFECFFEVNVHQQNVLCPSVSEEYILALSKKK
jgi:hypothetical protein